MGILDVDLTGPSIPRLLGIEACKVKQAPGGWLPVEVHPSQILLPAPPTTYSSPAPATTANGTSKDAEPSDAPLSTNGHAEHHPTQIGSLHAMSLAFLLASRSSAIVWRGPKKTAMVRQFLTSVLWGPTDYLLIDTPPGTSDEHISLVETLLKDVVTPLPSNTNGAAPRPQLAGAVIVTTPQAVAISDVRKELNFCGKTGVKVLGVVENMSGYVCECCGVATNLFSKGGGEVMARDFGVGFFGGVPLDSQWGLLVEEGMRPKYGGVVKDGVEEDADGSVAGEEVDDYGEAEINAPQREKEEGLLVDKYRSCSLSPIFEGIAKQVVDTVRSGTAVSVRPVVSS